MSETKRETENDLVFYSLSKKKLVVILIVMLLSWIFSLVFYLNPTWEHDILVAFNDLRADGELFGEFFYFYTKWFIYIFGFFLIGIYLSSFKVESLKKYRISMMSAVFLYAIGTTLIDTVIKDTIARPRPYTIWGELINMYPATGLSFPSGHTYIGFVMTLPLVFALLCTNSNFKSNGKKLGISILLIIYSTLMGLSRIFVGVHYPSDVLFSVGLALFATSISYLIIRFLLKKNALNSTNEKFYVIVAMIWLVIAIILFT